MFVGPPEIKISDRHIWMQIIGCLLDPQLCPLRRAGSGGRRTIRERTQPAPMTARPPDEQGQFLRKIVIADFGPRQRC